MKYCQISSRSSIAAPKFDNDDICQNVSGGLRVCQSLSAVRSVAADAVAAALTPMCVTRVRLRHLIYELMMRLSGSPPV